MASNSDSRIPRDLVTIIGKAIDKEPARRYQTAAELADDLRRFTDDQPIRARKSTPLERIRRWHRRNPAVAGLVWTLLVVLSSVVELGLARLEIAGPASFNLAAWLGPWWSLAASLLLVWALLARPPVAATFQL